jgi:peptidylprolyl isomerase
VAGLTAKVTRSRAHLLHDHDSSFIFASFAFQAQLEMKMDKALREVKSEKWGKISGLNNRAIKIFNDKQKDILKDVPADRQDAAKALIDDISKDLANLNTVIEGKKNAPVDTAKRAVLTKIGDLEQLMVKEFPYSIPKEFDNLPQLKGRATVEMVIKKANPEEKFDVDGTILDKLRLTIVLDGYSAPVTSGNVADLINRGFYNGMAVQRSDGFVIQTGDPNPDDEDAVHGFEPVKGQERTVPLEIMALEDKKPVYGVRTRPAPILATTCLVVLGFVDDDGWRVGSGGDTEKEVEAGRKRLRKRERFYACVCVCVCVCVSECMREC